MKTSLSSEYGYSLLMTFGIVLIFSVVGMSLITIVSNGSNKNEIRQNSVHSQNLSDKGVNYLLEDITRSLQDDVLLTDIKQSEFVPLLENKLKDSKLACPNQVTENTTQGVKIPSADGKTTIICIADVVKVSNEEADKYRRKVTIKSYGFSNGQSKVSEVVAIVGTTATPEQLRYALSTNNEGNLYLHGGVEIHGNVKTDGHLILSKSATHQSTNLYTNVTTTYWQPSTFTKIVSQNPSKDPKIIFSNDNKYIFNLNRFNQNHKMNEVFQDSSSSYYDDYLKSETFSDSDNYSDNSTSKTFTRYNPIQTNISSLFFQSPKIITEVNSDVPTDFMSISDEVQTQYNKTTGIKKETKNLNITTSYLTTDNDLIYVGNTSTETKQILKEVDTEKVCVKKKNIKGKEVCKKYKEVSKNIYETIYKNSPIPGQMKINTSGNPLELRGTYYIYGNLIIDNTKLKTNSIFYVDGDVTITNSTLQQINENSVFIVFARGNITVSNMSLDSDIGDGSKLNGFFYSKENMIMYGVRSQITLTGGISANRLILTGVRGNTKSDKYPSVSEQENAEPRLKIIYDEELISKFTNFNKNKESYIKVIDKPEIFSR